MANFIGGRISKAATTAAGTVSSLNKGMHTVEQARKPKPKKRAATRSKLFGGK